MSDNKKSSFDDYSFRNAAIAYMSSLESRLSNMEMYQAQKSKSKARGRRRATGRGKRNLRGMASLDNIRFKGFGSNPLK